jgi:exopolysaccharide production protein ExoQ
LTPQNATLLFALGILGLFLLARDRKAHTSAALWIPVVWLWIAASRPVSEWLAPADSQGAALSLVTPEQLMDGSPLDRYIFSALLIAGIIVLGVRGRRLLRLLRANVPILLFFLYCGVSSLWSDYGDVSFKRWVKALGDLVMILVVLTEFDPSAAVKRLLQRAAFLLIPASVLLVKYYPDLGRLYSPFTGEGSCTGVTSHKNQLGYVCLLLGLGSVWRIIEVGRSEMGGSRQSTRKTKNGLLLAHAVILVMVMWLFWMANSMTSFACFVMAVVLLVTTNFRAVGRRPGLVHLLVATILMVSVSALFLNLGSGLVQSMGRDPSLTGRTDLWNLVLGMAHSPLLGTGFDSFWLGKRLQHIWDLYWWHPVQAHDGYIDVYLNLGAVGLTLLAVLLLAGYRNIVAAFRVDSRSGSLRLAYFVVAVAYNFTESAFKVMDPIWIFLLLSMAAVPGGWVRVRSRKAVAVAVAEPPPAVPSLAGA